MGTAPHDFAHADGLCHAPLPTLHALDDRERIWDYYVRVAGKHTAEKVLREIAEAIALIEDHLFAGRARNEVRPDPARDGE